MSYKRRSTIALRRENHVEITLASQKRSDRLQRHTEEDCAYSCDSFAGSFTKGLNHNAENGVLSERRDYEHLACALFKSDVKSLDKVILAPTGKLEAPSLSFAETLVGAYPCVIKLPPPPKLASETRINEYTDLILRAAARDVPFSDYATSPVISEIVTIMNNSSSKLRDDVYFDGGDVEITPSNVFRGAFPGERKGNFISCILSEDIIENGHTHVQTYERPVASDVNNFMATLPEAITAQNGEHTRMTTMQSTPGKIQTLRDLAEFVHKDPPAWVYVNAVLYLANNKLSMNSYFTSNASGGVASLGNGMFHAISALGEVLRFAMHTTWYYKWRKYRTLRPEAYGIILAKEIGQGVGSGKDGRFLIPEELRNNTSLSAALDLLSFVRDIVDISDIDRPLLPQCYPEGSPQHPSYPAGHAVIAGALVTVIKMFFDTDETCTAASENGDITYNDELTKLASNIAYGRNAAGVHYASDGYYGILLGESIAAEYMSELMSVDPLRFLGTNPDRALCFTGFRGNTICITPFESDRPTALIAALISIMALLLIAVLVWHIAKKIKGV